MNLNPRACEYYRLLITTTPTVDADAWEMSIDDGATWKASQVVDDAPAWLIKGSAYAGVETDPILVSATVEPLLRLVDSPETIVRSAPIIRVGSL